MPVVGVDDSFEVDRFKEIVDRLDDVFAVVFRRTVGNVEAAWDEIVLDVDDQNGGDGFDDLTTRNSKSLDVQIGLSYDFDPVVPAEHELISIDVVVIVRVENFENLRQSAVVDVVRLTLAITEERPAKRAKLFKVQLTVAVIKCLQVCFCTCYRTFKSVACDVQGSFAFRFHKIIIDMNTVVVLL